MMYCSNRRNLNLKYLIFWAYQKWQNLTEFGGLKFCTVHYFRCQILSFFVQPKIWGISSWDFFSHWSDCYIYNFLRIIWNFKILFLNCSEKGSVHLIPKGRHLLVSKTEMDEENVLVDLWRSDTTISRLCKIAAMKRKIEHMPNMTVIGKAFTCIITFIRRASLAWVCEFSLI
jgi:hypothetical protein